MARELNRLLEDTERGNPRAREALFPVALAVVRLGASPMIHGLRELAADLYLLSLARLLRKGDKPLARDRPADELPIPDYGVGRELTVGERRSLARRPSRAAIEKLVLDPHPLVVRQLLMNPQLTEEDVVVLATRRPARIEVLDELSKMPRWLCRGRVRQAIILNPGSPFEIAIPLLSLCTRTELFEVVQSTVVSKTVRATAREWFEKRPPLKDWIGRSDMLQ
jgi:hypothetical protein